jgi:hypothetical protein
MCSEEQIKISKEEGGREGERKKERREIVCYSLLVSVQK